MKELTSYEKDLIMIGMISMSLNDSAVTQNTKRGLEGNKERANTRIQWFYVGHK